MQNRITSELYFNFIDTISDVSMDVPFLVSDVNIALLADDLKRMNIRVVPEASTKKVKFDIPYDLMFPNKLYCRRKAVVPLESVFQNNSNATLYGYDLQATVHKSPEATQYGATLKIKLGDYKEHKEERDSLDIPKGPHSKRKGLVGRMVCIGAFDKGPVILQDVYLLFEKYARAVKQSSPRYQRFTDALSAIGESVLGEPILRGKESHAPVKGMEWIGDQEMLRASGE